MKFEPSTPKRIALYTTGALAVSALAYVGWIRATPPEIGTLLSGVQLHVGMAATVPTDSENEKAVAMREEQMEQAWEKLRAAQAIDPDDFEVKEWEACLHIMDGDLSTAADRYKELATLTDDAKLRTAIQLREIEIRRTAEGPESALATFDRYGLTTADADITRAGIDIDRGDQESAVRRLKQSFARDDGGPTHKSSCVRILFSLRGTEEAESLCLAGPIRDSLRDYELARLKVKNSDTDNAVGLLMQSLSHQDEEVRKLFVQERGFWNASLGEEQVNRLKNIGAPAAPISGG